MANEKVCFLTTVHSPFDIRIFHKEAKSLLAAGYDITIVGQHNKTEMVDGIQIVNLPTPRNRIERMTRVLFSVFKKAFKIDADIYHFHDPELIPVGLRLKKYGKKVIYDIHEDYSEDILNKPWIAKFLRNMIANLFNRYEKKAAEKFNGVVTATPHISEKFERFNSNTIDINNYPILNSHTPHNCNEAVLNRNVNYVGAISCTRGIFEMIQALERTDARLILAGRFTTRKDYSTARGMKGWDHVDYRGQVDRSEVAIIMAESLAGIVLYHPGPNHDNSQPNKLFEYMAAGLPVIASNFQLWKHIVENNNCGICVNPLNSEEIAEAINWVFKNPKEAAVMGKNGLKAVTDKYNWEAESQKLITFYKTLLQ